MSIDSLAQTGAALARTAQARQPTEPATSRQELPGRGQAVPAPPQAGDVEQAVSRLNDYVQSLRRDLQFRVDEESDRVIVTVVDSETQEVIRQIPSEEVLAVARELEQAQGLLVNAKA